jgi:hypothetical protein
MTYDFELDHSNIQIFPVKIPFDIDTWSVIKDENPKNKEKNKYYYIEYSDLDCLVEKSLEAYIK